MGIDKKEISKEIKEEVQEIAVSAVQEFIDDSKIEEDSAVEILSATLDALLPLQHLLPGEMGKMAEELDDIVFEELARALLNAFKLNPDKIEERAARAEARGNHKVAARRRGRADRIRKRQNDKK